VTTDKEFGKYLAKIAEEQSLSIGIKVKTLRNRKDISSKELAERAGITPQTISRIEQGHTDVSFATLRKILAAMGYSLKDLANQEIELEMDSPKKNFNVLLKKLNNVGIDSYLLTNKILPSNIQSALNNHKVNEPSLLLDEAASYISTIYGWSQNEIWNSPNLIVKPEPAQKAFFKKPSNSNENQVKAYSHYAFYLSKIVLKAYPIKGQNDYPNSIEEFKKQYFAINENIDLALLLEFVWNLGICILPLSDSGVFHGASWNIEGRHIIVLKQKDQSHARWIFDLLHELYHVFVHLEKEDTSVIETEELNPFSNNETIEELEANSFANQVIFDNRATDLAEKCVALAKWDIKNLSKAVIQVSKEARLRSDFLANYMAFRLSFQDENWWGSAKKLQITEPDPFSIASEFLKRRIKMEKLSPIDYNLLNAALTN
jgi:transcriptional regulator with XRE-family HTH domain/Zn-dependent peptidase ImmA (M78 family)